jgi:hypothetical protein
MCKNIKRIFKLIIKKEDGGLDINPTSLAQYAGQDLFYYYLVSDLNNLINNTNL